MELDDEYEGIFDLYEIDGSWKDNFLSFFQSLQVGKDLFFFQRLYREEVFKLANATTGRPEDIRMVRLDMMPYSRLEKFQVVYCSYDHRIYVLGKFEVTDDELNV